METEKKKIDDTDKIDDTEKADNLENEAAADKSAAKPTNLTEADVERMIDNKFNKFIDSFMPQTIEPDADKQDGGDGDVDVNW